MQSINNQEIININNFTEKKSENENLKKIKTFIEKYWKFFVFVFGALFFFIIISEEKYTLEITTSPSNSIITFEGVDTKLPTYKKKLLEREYTIKVENERFIPQEKKINLVKDTSIHVVLLPLLTPESVKTNIDNSISPDLAVELKLFDKNTLIGINPKNGYLITISNGQTNTLHARDVYSYSYDKPFVYVIDRGNKTRLTEINIETKEKRTINLEKLAPIVSATLSPNRENLLILGNFELISRNTTLYKTPKNSLSLEEITTSIINEIKYLTNDLVLTVMLADANNLSVFSIHNVNTWKQKYSTKGNLHLLSPNKEKIIIQRSSSISIINISTLRESRVSVSESTKVAWSGDDTIVFIENTNPGIKMHYLNIENSVKSSVIEIPELSSIVIKTFVGIEDNVAHLVDTSGKFWNISLPF